MLKAITEANHFLETCEQSFRFSDKVIYDEDAYDIYMAKKDNGKPKDDYPSKYRVLKLCLDFEIKMPLK